MRDSAEAQPGGLRRYWFPVVTTGAFVVVIPMLLGRAHGIIPSGWLILLTLAAWMLDALAMPVAIILVGMAGMLLSRWLPLHNARLPDPLMIWLTIGIVQLVRLEFRVREELHRREAELQEEKREHQEWRAFFDNSPAAILVSDGGGRIIMGNPAAQKLLGYQGRPIEGVGIAQIIGALGAALRIDRKKMLFHDLTGCKGLRPNGEMFVADAWFFVGETPAGTRLGAVVVDAGERLQERARGGLRSSMATSQIAMEAVLHEVRNLSAASTLMYNNLAKAGMARYAGLRENADFESLGSLLKALVNIATTELRPGEVSYSSVNLTDILTQLRIIINPWFFESEMTVNWAIAPGLPDVCGDESGLLQLFLNLAQNSNRAMATCDEKRLTIEASLKGESVVVCFRDTGPGIENPDDLFQPLRRGAKIKGLGLFVSRAIAHSFHGELKYVPAKTGSCFQVELIPLREWQRVTGVYDGKTNKG